MNVLTKHWSSLAIESGGVAGPIRCELLNAVVRRQEGTPMKLGSEEFDRLIKQSAALRGGEDFAGAIDLIESRLTDLDPDCHLNAFMEAFHAAREAGMQDKATKYARKLAAIDPQIPTVKAFLADK